MIFGRKKNKLEKKVSAEQLPNDEYIGKKRRSLLEIEESNLDGFLEPKVDDLAEDEDEVVQDNDNVQFAQDDDAAQVGQASDEQDEVQSQWETDQIEQSAAEVPATTPAPQAAVENVPPQQAAVKSPQAVDMPAAADETINDEQTETLHASSGQNDNDLQESETPASSDESSAVSPQEEVTSGLTDEQLAAIAEQRANREKDLRLIRNVKTRELFRTFSWLLRNDEVNSDSLFYGYKSIKIIGTKEYDFMVTVKDGKEIYVRLESANNIVAKAIHNVKQFNVDFSSDDAFALNDDYYELIKKQKAEFGELSFEFWKNLNDQYLSNLKRTLVHLPSKMQLMRNEEDLDVKYSINTAHLINALTRVIKSVYSLNLLPNMRKDNSVLVIVDESANGFFYISDRKNSFLDFENEMAATWTIKDFFLTILDLVIKEVGYNDFFDDVQIYFHQAKSDFTREYYYPIATSQERLPNLAENDANKQIWVEPLVNTHPLLNNNDDIFTKHVLSRTNVKTYFESEDNLTRLIK